MRCELKEFIDKNKVQQTRSILIHEQHPPLFYYFPLLSLFLYSWEGGNRWPLIGVESSLFSTCLAIISKAYAIFEAFIAETSTKPSPYCFAKL